MKTNIYFYHSSLSSS